MNTKRLAVFAAPLAASGTLLSGSTVKADSPWSVKFGVSKPVDSDVNKAVGKSGFHFGLGYKLKSKGVLLGTSASSNVEFVFNHNSGNGNHLNYGALFYNEQINFGVGPGGHFYGGIGVGVAHINSKLTGPTGFGFEGAADLREGTFVPGGQSQGGNSQGGNSSGGGGNSQGGNSQGGNSNALQAAPPAPGNALAPPGTPVTTQSDSKNALAGKAIFGYAWQNGFFTEATYTITGKSQGARVGGFTLAIGMHF